ncbi:hypothetical protein K438DRAFT_1750255 [Mycena galopus ATCC 62051]|nr:hypothetical protein K438DRAFT_1750255 [Mycena galopus ATCC 62051]
MTRRGDGAEESVMRTLIPPRRKHPSAFSSIQPRKGDCLSDAAMPPAAQKRRADASVMVDAYAITDWESEEKPEELDGLSRDSDEEAQGQPLSLRDIRRINLLGAPVRLHVGACGWPYREFMMSDAQLDDFIMSPPRLDGDRWRLARIVVHRDWIVGADTDIAVGLEWMKRSEGDRGRGSGLRVLDEMAILGRMFGEEIIARSTESKSDWSICDVSRPEDGWIIFRMSLRAAARPVFFVPYSARVSAKAKASEPQAQHHGTRVNVRPFLIPLPPASAASGMRCETLGIRMMPPSSQVAASWGFIPTPGFKIKDRVLSLRWSLDCVIATSEAVRGVDGH